MPNPCTLTSKWTTPSQQLQLTSVNVLIAINLVPSSEGWKSSFATMSFNLEILIGSNSLGPQWVTPPAPAYATLYFGIHKLNFLPQFAPSLALYHHYIILGVWCHHPDPSDDDVTWKCFQSTMNSYGKLTWTFTPCSLSTNFMDLTITISPTGFSTALYEKPLHLSQYLPMVS